MALDDVHSVLLNRVLVRLYEDVATINSQIHQVHAGKHPSQPLPFCVSSFPSFS